MYRGYVDDPRNTDNAWMETVVLNFHDEAGTAVARCLILSCAVLNIALSRFPLQAGDDAKVLSVTHAP